MDVASYLGRIKYSGSVFPTADVLRELHVRHLLSVPFENLSIHWNEPIILREEALFEKIVIRKRGGFCYELNGLFAALLRVCGFEVSLLSGGVMDSNGTFGPEFDHMTLMVRLDQRWLVDVGFGDSFRHPLLLDSRDVQESDDREYRIDKADDFFTLLRKENSEWKPQYRFTLTARSLEQYEGMCRYHQTSPESHFTQRRICTLATETGRITLSDMRLITTNGQDRDERLLDTNEEYENVLKERFGIERGVDGERTSL